MKIYKRLVLIIALVGLARANAGCQTISNTFLIEAEEFQFTDKWIINKEHGVSGIGLLRVEGGGNPDANAYTAIDVAEGTYDVWTRSPDFPENQPGTRLFRLYVNEQPMLQSGNHGHEGYYWEKVGTTKINEGETLLHIKDTRASYGRCDAVLLSSNTSFNPNNEPLKALQKFKIVPKQLPLSQTSSQKYTSYQSLGSAPVLKAEINNGKLKLLFFEVKDPERGTISMVSSAMLFKEGKWAAINPNVEDNRIYLLTGDKPSVNFTSFYPAWANASGVSEFESRGKKIQIFDPVKAQNPFGAGELLLCNAISVNKTSSRQLTVTYKTVRGQVIKGVWKLLPNEDHFCLNLSYQADRTSYYSFVVSAFQPLEPAAVNHVQLPPMFQYQRIPDQPILIPSALSPQPLSIVETRINDKPLSFFVAGALSNFPQSWGSAATSPMGFSLKNENNQVQPVAFAPVLGLDESKLNKGESIQREFILGAVWDKWQRALEYASDSIFQVTDYRRQSVSSLSEAALNMVDLINNDERSGWSSKMKGFFDIEENPRVSVEVAPLSLLSAAILSRDEDMYIKRALPAIEYTLSRRGYRWSDTLGSKFTPDKKALKFSPYSPEFNVAYFEGLHKLLNEANPWLVDLALPGGKLRSVNSWMEKFAAYRLTGNAAWLKDAMAGVDHFLDADVYGTKKNVLSPTPFYNSTFYPNWWDLIDVYEQTKDKKYLDAAETASFYTIAGIRSYPKVSPEVQTIHSNNEYIGVPTIWWKNGKRYRLGNPRVSGDVQEKQVPAHVVSPVGLGLEQPSTFFLRNDPVSHVFMSNWSPNLLRLYQYTNRSIFEKYARNSIIGRFSNYPGYYARGFSDLTMQADYPVKGPDVSSIYYHHIPVHFAFTVDYLVTEAVRRSNGNVSFPWSRQEGFVWFNNRIYGAGKGKIHEDHNVELLLKKGLVKLDNPEVNYLTAVSKDKFWMILFNESTATVPVTAELAIRTQIAANSAYNIRTANKSTAARMQGRQIKATLKAKELLAISFPLTSIKVDEMPVKLTSGMQVIDLGDDLGKFYAFRIRSPFGWDSIYGYIDSPLENIKASLQLNSGQINQVSSYPYEWSYHSLPFNQNAVLNLSLSGLDRNITITMGGN